MRITCRALSAGAAVLFVLGLGAPALAGRGAQPSPGSVALQAPAGWSASADGKAVAEAKADLTAKVPSGPRARIVRTRQKKKRERAVVKDIKRATKSDPELVDGPTDATFGATGAPGTVTTFAVTTKGSRLVQRYVVVEPPGETSTVIVLEAPESQWDAAEPTLMAAIDVS